MKKPILIVALIFISVSYMGIYASNSVPNETGKYRCPYLNQIYQSADPISCPYLREHGVNNMSELCPYLRDHGMYDAGNMCPFLREHGIDSTAFMCPYLNGEMNNSPGECPYLKEQNKSTGKMKKVFTLPIKVIST